MNVNFFKIFSALSVLFVFSFFGCTNQTAIGPPEAVAATGQFCVNTGCGNSFSTPGWWPNGATFAYEVLDKTSKGQGYKVKTLVRQGNTIHHLDCARNLPSIQACLEWLVGNGYQVVPEGAESPQGGTGVHKTVNKGPIYKIPSYLYQ
jgi:hypothetical protein